MPIYRRQPYDIGAKIGGAGQNVLAAILGIQGMEEAKTARLAGAELDKAQAAAVAEEAARKQAEFLGKGELASQARAMYNAPKVPGLDIFTAAEQGFYPYNNMARSGQMSAAFPGGGLKEYMAAFPQVQLDVEAAKMWSENPELAQVRAATEGMQKASGINSVTIPGQGMRTYNPGGKQTGTRLTDIGGQLVPMPYEEMVPSSLGEPIRLTSEGNTVGTVTPEQALEAIRATQVPTRVRELNMQPQGTLLPPELATPTTPQSIISPSGFPVTVQPKPTVDLRKVITELIMKLYGAGQPPMYSP